MEPVPHELLPKHSEEIQEIIFKTPSWILKWGIAIFFTSLLLIVGLSAFVEFPEVIQTQLTITSAKTPKPIISKVGGRLTNLLVSNGQQVNVGDLLGVLESNANYRDVLKLHHELLKLQDQLLISSGNLDGFPATSHLKLGEVQEGYQNFYQAWLNYKASIKNGYFIRKKAMLTSDIVNIQKGEKILKDQLSLQKVDLNLAEEEYLMHKRLLEQKVEAKMEFKREESRFIAKKFPLQQTAAALINSTASRATLAKQILEIDNMISMEKLKFVQSLNILVSQLEKWKSDYLLTATSKGNIIFAGMTQESQYCKVNQEVFYIDHEQGVLFGQMSIPQYNMGKVKVGQRVLIKLNSYPFQEYGMISGKVNYVSNVPYKDSIFVSQVAFDNEKYIKQKAMLLKNGMTGQADIVTEEASILKRMVRSFYKIMNSREM